MKARESLKLCHFVHQWFIYSSRAYYCFVFISLRRKQVSGKPELVSRHNSRPWCIFSVTNSDWPSTLVTRILYEFTKMRLHFSGAFNVCGPTDILLVECLLGTLFPRLKPEILSLTSTRKQYASFSSNALRNHVCDCLQGMEIVELMCFVHNWITRT
jgi:hypothetical protein